MWYLQNIQINLVAQKLYNDTCLILTSKFNDKKMMDWGILWTHLSLNGICNFHFHKRPHTTNNTLQTLHTSMMFDMCKLDHQMCKREWFWVLCFYFLFKWNFFFYHQLNFHTTMLWKHGVHLEFPKTKVIGV